MASEGTSPVALCLSRCASWPTGLTANAISMQYLTGTNASCHPAELSTDVWATVIANVAPLMALVGERNAKEFLRTISTWHQLLLLSCAPLGILAIMVSAIRLSGPSFLKRLVGRDSERRTEALVEVTPLSVRPATSVYTSRAVEVEATINNSGVAFVGGHVKEADGIDGIEAFKQILRSHADSAVEDNEDMEAVLVLWSTGSLEQVSTLFDYLTDGGSKQSTTPFIGSIAAVSYRTTGISPTQRHGSLASSRYGLWNILASSIALFLMTGTQVLGAVYGHTPKKTLYMGLAAYAAIVAFTFLLLKVIQGEIYAEKNTLAPCFNDALWSFSNSTHTQHRRMARPSSNTLVTARPFEANTQQRFWRKVITTALTACLIGSYVPYYISMRVSPWWVSLTGVGIIWTVALYRSLFSPTTIVALENSIGKDEHWIGMFRRTLDESLLATLEGAHDRSSHLKKRSLPSTLPPSPSSDVEDYIVVEPAEKTEINTAAGADCTAFLLIRQPIRIALNSWSGAEDVIKAGLEFAKIACQTQTNSFLSHKIREDSYWLRIVRMRISIYIPGLVWRSHHEVDLALTPEFKLDDVIRHILKLFHVCIDQTGTVTRHSVNRTDAVELSHVLCGPVADPPVRKDFNQRTATLREVLVAVRENERNADCRKFSLEQTLLLPSIMLASTYDRWKKREVDGESHHAGAYGQEIAALQDTHFDKLAPSGLPWLPSLQRELERLNILEDFMSETGPETTGASLAARSDDAGHYSTANRLISFSGNVNRLDGRNDLNS